MGPLDPVHIGSGRARHAQVRRYGGPTMTTTDRPRDSRSGPPRRASAPAAPVAPAKPRPQDLPDYVDAPLGDSNWTAFFKPVRSSKPGTMPAGMVLVVVVAALLVAMFVSADSINRKASSRRNNSDLRKTTASAVATLSEALKLDTPAKSVDDAVAPYIGHERKTDNISSDDIVAQRRAREAAAGEIAAPAPTAPTTASTAGPGAVAPASTAPSTPPTTADPRPKLPTPTPDKPLKLWIGGDSIAYEPGIALTNIAAQTKLFNVTVDSRASTGLTRPDFFNWPQYLDRDIVPIGGGPGLNPDVMIIMFGGNDAQGIPMPPPIGGYALGTAEWQKEYRQRVGDTMDLLKSTKNDRLVMWIGAPIMSSKSVQHLDQLNYIYYTEAKKRPWVVFLDSWGYFTDPAGAYSKTLTGADGQPHVVRANDNVHLNVLGGDWLAAVALAKLGKSIDLSAGPFTPEPDKSPPPEAAERPEVPPGDGQDPVP